MTKKWMFLFIAGFFVLPGLGDRVAAQSDLSFRGQLSTWSTVSPDPEWSGQLGARYIPELSLFRNLTAQKFIDAELAANIYGSGSIQSGRETDYSGKLKPYRLWLRYAATKYEIRLGLQKINFGSATLFRPLMWFDRIDPRDPLKLTDGVYGLLLRYYFQNNANIWLWGLYDNNDLKGWEAAPTEDNGIEFGGRVQLPVFTGEAGFSYHHRRADFSQFPGLATPLSSRYVEENRFAFDGKWDAVIGIWFEGSVTHRYTDLPLLKYQRMWTVGADYTFGVGNGLNVLGEFFSSENTDKIFKSGAGSEFTGLSANYPVGLFDTISGIFYRDLTNRDTYFTLNWQRTYDNWILHLLAYFNPETAQLNQTQSGNNAFAGNGFQVMIVFNH